MENSPKDVSVIRIQAKDPDLTSTPSHLSYRISAGNPQNFFMINPKTGNLTHLTQLTAFTFPCTWMIDSMLDKNYILVLRQSFLKKKHPCRQKEMVQTLTEIITMSLC